MATKPPYTHKPPKPQIVKQLKTFFKGLTVGDQEVAEDIMGAIRGPDIFEDWKELKEFIEKLDTSIARYTAFEWLKANYTAKIRAAILPNFPGDYNPTPIRTKDLNILEKINTFVKDKTNENCYQDHNMQAYRHYIQHLKRAAKWIVKRNRTE